MRAILAWLGAMLAALAFATLVMTMPAIDAGFYDPEPVHVDEEAESVDSPRSQGLREVMQTLDAPESR